MTNLLELIRNDPAIAVGATAVYQYKPKMEKKYRFTSRFGDIVELFRIEGGLIHLPRALCPHPKEGTAQDKRADGEEVDFPKDPTPRPHQVQLFSETAKFLGRGQSGVVSAYTGWGKTVLGYHAAYMCRRKTLVITTKDDIYQQWLEGAVKFLGLHPSEVGEIRQDKCEVVGTKFVVAMIHSLSIEDKYPDWITKDFGLVIFDECVPAGTLVDGRAVETLRAGDPVLSWGTDGLTRSRLTDVRVKKGDVFAHVCAGGQELIATEYHPVFVDGLGFIPQALVEVGDALCVVRGDDAKHETSASAGCKGPERDLLPSASGGVVLREDEGGQPDLSSRWEGKAERLPEREGTTVQAWRERHRVDDASADVTRCFIEFGGSSGVSPRIRRRSIAEGLAEIVRVGLGATEVEARDRARRAFAQYFEGAGFRCPEGSGVDVVRVDSVEVQERVRAVELGWCGADGAVYDLEVERTHTFFANGVLTHNCHRVPADQFSNVVTMFAAKLRLGLSATPSRADGKELLVEAHIGPIRAKTEAQLMVPKVLRIHSNWQCPRVLRTNKDSGEKRVVKLPHEPGKTSHIEKIIAADPERNALVAELIASAFEKGRKVVVFSTLHDHLKSLHRACRDQHKISGKFMGFYVGAQTKADKEHREREKVKPILFTTYVMCAEGTDIPWLDTVVLAMPRSNVTQPAGRIRREFPDKAEPTIIDIMDTDSPVFAGYCAARMKWYVSIRAQVINLS